MHEPSLRALHSLKGGLYMLVSGKPEEVIVPIKQEALEIQYTSHARQRMDERHFSEDDVRFTLEPYRKYAV
jgi:hypothetical protein